MEELYMNYVLMSIREKYFQDILDRKKSFEYRKKYSEFPTIAYIYVSKTQKKIKAIIEFDKPIVADSVTISKISEKEQPGSYYSMLDYLDRGIGYALPIKKVTLIEEISLKQLKELFPEFVAPQSYYKLEKKVELLNFLKSRKKIEELEINNE